MGGLNRLEILITGSVLCACGTLLIKFPKIKKIIDPVNGIFSPGCAFVRWRLLPYGVLETPHE